MRKNRVTIGLTDEIYKVLSEIKDLSGSPISTQISNLLIESYPALEFMADSLRLAQGLQGAAKRKFSQALKEIEPEFAELQKRSEKLLLQTDEQMDLFRRRKKVLKK